MSKKKAGVLAVLSGEMAVKDVPVSESVNIEELKKGDDDPLEVVVEIPVSESTRGWYYTHEALKDIVNVVNEKSLHGLMGHQKEENIATEFPEIVTHWIGAKMTDTAAYFRGIVDASATQLKRWIRSGVIKNVSIYGNAHLAEDDYGRSIVVGYEPLSIDWTPLDRMGMPTRVVSVGEMHMIDGSENEKDEERGGTEVKPEELLSKLTTMMKNRQITPTMIGQASGMKVSEFVGEMDSNLSEDLEVLSQVKEKLGVDTAKKVLSKVEGLKQRATQYESAQATLIAGEMANEKIKNEAAAKDLFKKDTILGKLWTAHAGEELTADKTKLSAEMDAFLEDAATKSVLASYKTGASQGVTILSGEMTNHKNKENTETVSMARF